MTSYTSELQRIIEALRKEPLCAVVIDSTGEHASVDLVLGHSISYVDVHPSILAALQTRGLLAPRIVETLTERGILPSAD